MTEVNVKNKTRSFTMDIPFGDNLEESVAKFGAEVVHQHFIAGAKLAANAAIRRYFDKDIEDEGIIQRMANWTLGIRATREASSKDPKKSILANFVSLSASDKMDLIASLQEQLAKLQQG